MRRHMRFLAVLATLALVALPAVPASASTPSWFGAKLTHETQPTGKEYCDQYAGVHNNANCTWVAVEAFENGAHAKAPKDGTIHKVKLISCKGGSFVLQVARKQSGSSKFKVVKNIKTITYTKDTQAGGCGGEDGDNYKIQSFSVNFTVKQGDYIAVKAPGIGFLHNSSSGDSKVFDPPLAPNGGYHSADSGSGGMLIQFRY